MPPKPLSALDNWYLSAFTILANHLRRSPTVREFARYTQRNVHTVHDALRVLVSAGVLAQDVESGRYKLPAAPQKSTRPLRRSVADRASRYPRPMLRLSLLLIPTIACSKAPDTRDEQRTPEVAREGVRSTRVEADNECIVTSDRLAFQVLIPIHYSTFGDSGPRDSRQLYSWTCDLKANTCEGIQLKFDHIDAGKPISFLDLGTASGGTIVDRTGDVFVLKWGGFRTFTVDLSRHRVVYVEASHNTDGRGEVECKPH